MATKLSALLVDKRRNETIEIQLTRTILRIAQAVNYDHDEPLPTINEIAHHYQIDEAVVAAVYADMISQDRLIFVNDTYYFKPFVFSTLFYSKIVSIYDQIASAGLTPSFRIIHQNTPFMAPLTIDDKSYTTGSFTFSSRVFYANESPVIVYESYINKDVVDVSLIDSSTPLYQQLKEKLLIDLHYSKRRIKAVKLSDDNCDLLHLPKGSVGIRVSAETYNEKNQLIEVLVGYSTSHYRIEY